MVVEDGNLKVVNMVSGGNGVPGEAVVKLVVEELEREAVLTQNHLTIQKELIVMDHLVIDATLTIVKLMEVGVPGEVVVKPVVEELERDFVLIQHHLILQKELIVMDRLVRAAIINIVNIIEEDIRNENHSVRKTTN